MNDDTHGFDGGRGHGEGDGPLVNEFHADRLAARDLLDAIDAMIIVVDASARIVLFNRACQRASGYREDEIIGRKAWEILAPAEEVGALRRDYLGLQRGEFPLARVGDWIARDGVRRRVSWSNAVVRDARGTATLVVGTGIDVTERSQAVTSLRDRDERLRAVVNTAVDGIITVDRRGMIESLNPAAERLFGYDVDELLDRPVHTLMPPPHRQAHQGYIENYLRTGDAKVIGTGREVTGLRKDGTTFPVELAVSEVAHLGLFVGIVRDLTERRESEEQLRQTDRLASIGSLAAGLGHDMNNVLLPMRARLDALDAADLPEQPRQHLRAIRDSVAYLQQSADGLHMLAVDPLDDEASDRSTVVAEWWHQVGPLLQRSLPGHVRLTSSLPEDLPPAAIAPHRLTQIALNLLINAGDAVGSDGRVSIRASLMSDEQSLCVCVSDDGTGMPEAVRMRAFEAFFTTKDRGRGTGLGLALVHGIVTSAGGTIGIESEPGKGTTVRLTLPLTDAKVTHDGDASAEAPRVAVISIGDERIASLISAFLEGEGFSVSFDSVADSRSSILWIASAADTDVIAVQRFLKVPGRQVIMCGPDVAAWERLGALVIEDVTDFEVVRARVGEVLR
ncbi:MAG: PAS domain S-box protein [Planctomycetota bacterium]|jgi:PAS domain S-box-containing protein